MPVADWEEADDREELAGRVALDSVEVCVVGTVVVEMVHVDVITRVELAGQSVTVAAQLVTVISCVV